MDKCPKCGDGVAGRGEDGTWFRFPCETVVWGKLDTSEWITEVGKPCLRRQLSQRDARIADLEAKLAAASRLAQDSAEAAGEMADGGVRLTNEQAVIVSAYTGVLICDFADMQRAIEAKLGRPVWTHEFVYSGTAEIIKDAFREDFLALAPQEAAHD